MKSDDKIYENCLFEAFGRSPLQNDKKFSFQSNVENIRNCQNTLHDRVRIFLAKEEMCNKLAMLKNSKRQLYNDKSNQNTTRVII